jgi:hypothetical protein
MPETNPPESGPWTAPALATPADAVQELPNLWQKASVLVKVSATNPVHSEKNTQWSEPFRNPHSLPDRINPVLRTKRIASIERPSRSAKFEKSLISFQTLGLR